MKRLKYLLLLPTIAMAACANKYVVNGSSAQFIPDGTRAYIRQMSPNPDQMSLVTIDSCEVLHGNFHMSGSLDSVMMVLLCMGDAEFPIVLETGEVVVNIANNQVKIEGTPLNDRLYQFLSKRDSLKMAFDELPNRETHMYLEGYTQEYIMRELGAEEYRLRTEVDQLETRFIIDNFDNALGVAWFMQLCYDARDWYGFPTTTPQIDEIYSKAPKAFKLNEFISAYMKQVDSRIDQ